MADLSGRWDVWSVIAAMTRFADAAVQAALAGVCAQERARGKLPPLDNPETAGPGGAPAGYFVLAMGKHGAGELNYSSDVDLVVFFDRARMAEAGVADPSRTAIRLTQSLVAALQEVTPDGYVFRADLRLRPDPGATAPAVTTDAALRYYGSLGQTWERAAFIKARPIAGDVNAAHAFLSELSAFVWRRSLDFAALDDLHAMMRQVRAAGGQNDQAGGADLKRGRGGVREIEFFAQCQQLIYGGRDPTLRAPATRDALGALERAGHVTAADMRRLASDYAALRDVEHRLQMLEDQPLHTLSEHSQARTRLAAMCGYKGLAAFDAAVARRFSSVRTVAGKLFRDADEQDEQLLVDPVDDSAATRNALQALGFENPERVTAKARAWMAGRARAARSKRAQALLRRVLPSLAEACGETSWPDEAFRRFAAFFDRLNAGVQILSLFNSEPALLRAIVQVIALSERLSDTLAEQPGAIEVMLDASFAAPLEGAAEGAPGAQASAAIRGEAEFETALNIARRVGREQMFRVGAHVLLGRADATSAGAAFSGLAEGIVGALSEAAAAEMTRRHGAIDARFVIVGLGKLGGRELSVASDLDLMLVYEPSRLDAASDGPRSLSADQYFARLTQRLIAALSAPTEEGALYEVDMQLRPSGSAGPIAVRRSAFLRYYAAEAWTWELMALSRARIVAGDAALADALTSDIAGFLARPRDPDSVRNDAAAMRKRVAEGRPARGAWDLKLAPGGLMDVEFAVQTLQLAEAWRNRSILAPGTLAALRNLIAADIIAAADAEALTRAAQLQLDLTQLVRLMGEEPFDPTATPERRKAFLASAVGFSAFSALETALCEAQADARKVFLSVVGEGAST